MNLLNFPRKYRAPLREAYAVSNKQTGSFFCLFPAIDTIFKRSFPRQRFNYLPLIKNMRSLLIFPWNKCNKAYFKLIIGIYTNYFYARQKRKGPGGAWVSETYGYPKTSLKDNFQNIFPGP